MINDFEASEPLLNEPGKSTSKRKERYKQPGTVKSESALSKNFNKQYDKKEEKEKNKFIFKIYLHLLGQSIFIFIMLYFAFQNPFLNSLIIGNNIVLYVAIIIFIVTLFQPLISDQILKKAPQNYIYLFIFTLCFSYILCTLGIYFDFYLIMIMSLLNIIEIIYLAIESYISKTNEKKDIDIPNTAVFMGLFLLLIGSTLCFLKKISILKFSAIFLILMALGVYLLYDMNCIFLDSRREFKNTEYVLASIFIYIDILSTLLELSEKLFNSCEPERKINKKQSVRRSMIFTGEEDYQNYYKTNSEEKGKKGNEDDEDRKLHRRLSSRDLIRKKRFFKGDNPIMEDAHEDEDQEVEIKGEESKEKEDFSGDNEDKDDKDDKDDDDDEGNLSFKKQNDHVLKMDDEDEDNNDNNNNNDNNKDNDN